jgi:hypothetical protein
MVTQVLVMAIGWFHSLAPGSSEFVPSGVSRARQTECDLVPLNASIASDINIALFSHFQELNIAPKTSDEIVLHSSNAFARNPVVEKIAHTQQRRPK